MGELLAALTAFALFHLVPAAGPVRRALVGRLGAVIYIAGYSLVSLALLAWVGHAYAAAGTDVLWPQWPWTRWVPALVMPVACVLLVGALVQPNPLSVGARARAFDPARPGIVSVTRHPLVWALALWAGAHLFPNGDTASVALFGSFLTLALAGLAGLDAKARRALGGGDWMRLAARTSSVPFWAVLTGRARLDWRGIVGVPLVGGLILYGALLAAHPYVIGVSPLP